MVAEKTLIQTDRHRDAPGYEVSVNTETEISS